VRSVDATSLRRDIGYVIQHVGLFPHMTIAANISVVPTLLGWPKDRIRQRVSELLDLVRLDPGFTRRYPAQLSGGRRSQPYDRPGLTARRTPRTGLFPPHWSKSVPLRFQPLKASTAITGARPASP